jgi:hypothetical protein
LSLRNIITVEETCIFKPDACAPSTSTEFSQSAKITALGVFSSVAKLIEDAAISRFKCNAVLGKQGLEQVIDKVVEEARGVGRSAERIVDEAREKVESVARGFERVDFVKESL